MRYSRQGVGTYMKLTYVGLARDEVRRSNRSESLVNRFDDRYLPLGKKRQLRGSARACARALASFDLEEVDDATPFDEEVARLAELLNQAANVLEGADDRGFGGVTALRIFGQSSHARFLKLSSSSQS